MTTPLHPPVEKKVTAASGTTALVVAFLIAALSLAEGDQLIEGFPDWVPIALGSLLAAGSAFLAGKSAPHTARPDLPDSER